MKTTYKNKMFSSSVVLSVLAFLSLLFVGIGNVQAADPQFNYMSNDLKTLRLGNYTTSAGSYNWVGTLTAAPGNRIALDVYYHNGVDGTTATNTRMRVTPSATSGTQMVMSGALWADNATQVNDTATLNITSSQTITFENQARWIPNQGNSAEVMLPVTTTGNGVEVNIGSVAGGWATQGHVIFYLNISNNPTTPSTPTVNAGSDVSVNETQSIGLSGSATDPQGYTMTYSWTCTGGSLNSSTILNPVFTAPSVSATTTYTCTLTALNSYGNSASDTVSITVANVNISGEAPVVNIGTSNISLNGGQSVVFSATATDPQGDTMTYSWTCTGGSLTSSTVLNPTYTAPSVSATTTYTCTLTARDNGGNTGAGTIFITVSNSGSTGGSGSSSGWGGPALDVTLTANPSVGTSPLNGVDLTATVNSVGVSEGSITYSFDCENNGTWDLRVETTNTTYTATDLCNYYYDDSYSAKVKVEKSGYISYSQTSIRTGAKYASSYGISVDAGPNRDIGENQSVGLNGYGYSQYGYNLTYNWTCNGGSLSNANALTPTYYAPTVNTDTTYTCTLYVTDSRGYKNSDVVSIIVRNTGTGTSSGLAVTTNTPTNLTGTSATLNSTITNAGGQYTSVRFNWGRLSAYNNYTPWVSNKTTGQSNSHYVSGLEKGKTYHYRAEASNGKETVVGLDVSFITKPDSTSNFAAYSAGSGQVSLSWRKAASSCFTMVTRKAGSYPANSSDGTIVYYGTGSSVIDTGLLDNGTLYYYRAWSVGCDEGLISYSDSQYARAYATTAEAGYVAPTAEAENTSVEALVRDATQNEIAWQNSITANPNDEIEFKVIITPTGSTSLQDVVLKANLADKIESIRNIKIDGESYNGSLNDEMKLGTIALGESKEVTFTGKVAARDSFSYGSNEVLSSIEITAKNNAKVTKEIKLDVIRSVEAEAGLISLIDMKTYAGILTLLFLFLVLYVMYLLIERKRGKECLTEKAASTKVEKSKYFNIK